MNARDIEKNVPNAEKEMLLKCTLCPISAILGLYNLAIRYSELNRREEALRAAEEAVRLLIPFFV